MLREECRFGTNGGEVGEGNETCAYFCQAAPSISKAEALPAPSSCESGDGDESGNTHFLMEMSRANLFRPLELAFSREERAPGYLPGLLALNSLAGAESGSLFES